MTTSGTSSWNPARDVVIKRALRMVGAYASSGNPRPEQINDANDVLNMMLKEWQLDGFLWLRIYGTLFLNKGQRQYNLAPTTYTGFSHCTTSYAQTTTSAAAIVGASSVTLTSATGFASCGFIGVGTASGLLEWFYLGLTGSTAYLFSKTLQTAGTITNGVKYLIQDYVVGDDFTNIGAASNATGVMFTSTGTTPTTWTKGSSLCAASSLAEAAASGSVVYCYPTANHVNRPTRISSAVRKLYDATAANGYEVPIYIVSRTDYENLPSKTTQGKIINLYYDPQMVAGVVSVWPTADSPGDKLVLTMDRPLQDITADTQTYDFPQEAMTAISYGLALQIEPEYPLDVNSFQKLKVQADGHKQKLLNYNRENAPTQFQPEWR